MPTCLLVGALGLSWPNHEVFLGGNLRAASCRPRRNSIDSTDRYERYRLAPKESEFLSTDLHHLNQKKKSQSDSRRDFHASVASAPVPGLATGGPVPLRR